MVLEKKTLLACMGCEKIMGQISTICALQLEKNCHITNLILSPSIAQVAAGEIHKDDINNLVIALNGCGVQCVSKILKEKGLKPALVVNMLSLIKGVDFPKSVKNTLELIDHQVIVDLTKKIEQFLQENLKIDEKVQTVDNDFEFQPSYSAPLQFTFSKFEFKVPVAKYNLFFNWNDAWGYYIGDNKVVVGITDYLQQNLSDIMMCEFNQIGQEVGQFEALATLESTKTVNEVLSPFSGKILGINYELKEHPELINQSPYEKGWIAIIEVAHFDEEKAELMGSDQYFEFMKEKIEQEGVHK